MVSLNVFGESDFANSLILNSPVLALSVVPEFCFGAVDAVAMFYSIEP
jgi:hypothetical protein